MEFKSLKKVHEGKFIARYDVTYETADGKDKVYEMISRDKNIQDFDDLRNLEDGKKVDAVVLIMHDETGEKILLNREFRLAAGEFVYNFPAGLIEQMCIRDRWSKIHVHCTMHVCWGAYAALY